MPVVPVTMRMVFPITIMVFPMLAMMVTVFPMLPAVMVSIVVLTSEGCWGAQQGSRER